MWSEYPTTVDEAFKVSTEGVYLAKQITTARQQNRIGKFRYRPGIPVNTFWDLGVDDDIAIWCHQTVGAIDHFIDYFECSNEAYDFVVKAMQAKGCVWGRHYLPHDGNQRRPGQISLQTPRDMLEGLGLSNILIVPRTPDLVAVGIQELRTDFATYCFDEEACKPGLVHLEGYRKAWNQGMGVWSEHPAKNGHQHAADALRQKAQMSDEVRRYAISSGTTVPRRANRSGLAV